MYVHSKNDQNPWSTYVCIHTRREFTVKCYNRVSEKCTDCEYVERFFILFILLTNFDVSFLLTFLITLGLLRSLLICHFWVRSRCRKLRKLNHREPSLFPNNTSREKFDASPTSLSFDIENRETNARSYPLPVLKTKWIFSFMWSGLDVSYPPSLNDKYINT